MIAASKVIYLTANTTSGCIKCLTLAEYLNQTKLFVAGSSSDKIFSEVVKNTGS